MNELSLFVLVWVSSGLLGTLWNGYNHWKDGNDIILVEVVGAIFVGIIFGGLILGFVFTEKFGNVTLIKGKKRNED